MQKKKVDRKRFVRYKEGAELYSMCQSKFEDMARDAVILINVSLRFRFLKPMQVSEFFR